MVIKEEFSEQDNIDIALELYNLLGITNKKLRKSRILCCVNLALGIIMIILGFNFFKQSESIFFFPCFLLILGTVYVFRSIFGIIFLKRSYKSRLIKGLKKYNEATRKKYNISDTHEVATEIKDGYIETSSLGTIVKYSLKDYVTKLENERFYIFEFTNGRYIFFKKETFENKEKYDELVKEIVEAEKANEKKED